jgi:hypothetical protein
MKKEVPKIFWQAPDKSVWVFFKKDTYEIITVAELYDIIREKYGIDPEKTMINFKKR